MVNTRNQVNEIYYSRMQALFNKINKDKQAQIDRDVEAAQKRDELYGKISAGLTAANLTKDLILDPREQRLARMTYGEDTDKFGKPLLKYKYKQDRPLKEVLTPKGILESLKRLTPKGKFEERSDY